MSEVDVRIRFVVGDTADLAREATDKLREIWATKFLRARGFHVAPANEHWERAGAFCRRVKIHTETLRRNLERPGRPHVLVKRGATNRVVEILSNPAFEKFITRNKKRLNRESEIIP